MIVLVGDTRSHANVALLKKLGWGRMRVLNMTKPFENEPWGLDNGAYIHWRRKTAFDGDGFLRRVDKALAMSPRPMLAVVPDVVAGGLESLELSLRWLERLPAELPWYLAVQDGMTANDVAPHLAKFAGLFLGGSDRFKSTALRWATLASWHGLKFHYGRAGTPAKIASAIRAECTSLDSCFPLWSEARMEMFRRMVDGYEPTVDERRNYHRGKTKMSDVEKIQFVVPARSIVNAEEVARRVHEAQRSLAVEHGERPDEFAFEQLPPLERKWLVASVELAFNGVGRSEVPASPPPSSKPGSNLAPAVKAALGMGAHPFKENLSLLVDSLELRGIEISLVDLSGMTTVQRDVARIWAEQGGDVPAFLEKYVEETGVDEKRRAPEAACVVHALGGASGECAACAAGTPYEGSEYKHACAGPGAPAGSLQQQADADQAAHHDAANMIEYVANGKTTPIADKDVARSMGDAVKVDEFDHETRERLIALAVKNKILTKAGGESEGAWALLLGNAPAGWINKYKTKRGRKATKAAIEKVRQSLADVADTIAIEGAKFTIRMCAFCGAKGADLMGALYDSKGNPCCASCVSPINRDRPPEHLKHWLGPVAAWAACDAASERAEEA